MSQRLRTNDEPFKFDHCCPRGGVHSITFSQDQWYFNGTTPVGTNGPTLGLSNLSHPTLLSPQISNGDFTFVLNGDTGQKYIIEATTNWQDWEQVGSLSNGAGQSSFTHTNASSSAFRAYRARLMP